MISLYQTHPVSSVSFSVWACLSVVSLLGFLLVGLIVRRKAKDREDAKSKMLLAGLILLFSLMFGSVNIIPWATFQLMFIFVPFAESDW